MITRLAAGAGLVALRGAAALDPDAFTVTLIVGSGDHLLGEAKAAGLTVVVEPALRAPIAPGPDLRALRRLRSLFDQRGFDVVHTHCAKAGTLGRLAAHAVGVPRIVHTLHGFPFHESQSRPRRAAYAWIERRLGRITDTTLCVGSAVAAEAVRRGLVAPHRARTIGVVVDGDAPVRTPWTRVVARRALGLPLDVPVVGAVGRLVPQKAPEDFVAAMCALRRPDALGVWVGGGELADRVRELAARALPSARVVLTGERTDVPAVLPAFDVFVLPSRYEGLPVAIVEAMVCGVPVVATAVNSVPNVVVPGETGLLVPPGRPDLLAAAVGYLLAAPREGARLAANAGIGVARRHSSAALAAVLTAVYEPEHSDIAFIETR